MLDYNENREKYNALGEKVLYTGTIDSYYDYCFGKLEYRSLKFETETLDKEVSGSGCGKLYGRETPYTRI